VFGTIIGIVSMPARDKFEPYTIYTLVEEDEDGPPDELAKKWAIYANVADLRYGLTQGEVSAWNHETQQFDNFGNETVRVGEELDVEYKGLRDPSQPAGPENKHRFVVTRAAFPKTISSSVEFGQALRKFRSDFPEPDDNNGGHPTDDIPFD